MTQEIKNIKESNPTRTRNILHQMKVCFLENEDLSKEFRTEVQDTIYYLNELLYKIEK